MFKQVPRDDGKIDVQKKVRFLLFFKRWKTVATFETTGAAWLYITANGG